MEPATDDSVAAVDQASHQSLVGIPGRAWAGLLSPFPFFSLGRAPPLMSYCLPVGGGTVGGVGGVQQSGPDTRHFSVVCPALSCQPVWPGRGHCDLRPWCHRELCPWVSELRPCPICASSVSARSPRTTSSQVRAWLDPEDTVIPSPCPRVQEQAGQGGGILAEYGYSTQI